MNYNQAKIHILKGGWVKRRDWEQTKIAYDINRGTLFIEHPDGERKKFLPNDEEKDATDWVVTL